MSETGSSSLARWLGRAAGRVKHWVASESLDPEAFQKERARLLAQAPTPVIWLFGKAQSGKSSIVRFLTGAADAEIGEGFRPKTDRTREYAFPNAAEPLVRFLDTRGLGEVNYDAVGDLEVLDGQAHAVIVTAQVGDFAQDAVLAPLRQLRSARPARPIILALTCLHKLMPRGAEHPQPYPFGDGSAGSGNSAVPEPLSRALAEQTRRFEGLADSVAAIDLTDPVEGFADANYGGERLKKLLLSALPAAFGQSLASLTDAMAELTNLHERQATQHVLTGAAAAAAAGAVPVPLVDIPLVAAAQRDMVRRIAEVYGRPPDDPELYSALGVGGLGSQGLRVLLTRVLTKFVPYVGSAIGAASAYASTYALGRACCVYFGRKLAGQPADPAELQRVFAEQLAAAERRWTGTADTGGRK